MTANRRSLKAVFMGTPGFAVASLDHLVTEKYNIAAVVTAPDKPSGRGRRVNESEVKKYALQKGLKLFQPANLNDPVFIDELKKTDPDIIVVVAFRMLPEAVWRIPPLGTFNLHASLLPQYRGAAPINRAIMNGETETGLTTFFIDNNIDTGRIILQEKMMIGDDETAGELHDRMKDKGALMVAKTIDMISEGGIVTVPQRSPENSRLKAAPKIFREETGIDWHKPAKCIKNHIRGLSPYPAAYMTISHHTKGNSTIKILKCNLVNPVPVTGQYPEILTDNSSFFRIALPDGTIDIVELQMKDRKRMTTVEFLRGFDLNNDWKLVF